MSLRRQTIDEASVFAGTAAAAKSLSKSTNCEDCVAAAAAPSPMSDASSGVNAGCSVMGLELKSLSRSMTWEDLDGDGLGEPQVGEGGEGGPGHSWEAAAWGRGNDKMSK